MPSDSIEAISHHFIVQLIPERFDLHSALQRLRSPQTPSLNGVLSLAVHLPGNEFFLVQSELLEPVAGIPEADEEIGQVLRLKNIETSGHVDLLDLLHVVVEFIDSFLHFAGPGLLPLVDE